MKDSFSAFAKFIVLESIDSQVIKEQGEQLYSWLRENRVRTHLTREPSDGPFGSQIRFILDGRLDVDNITLGALFATDRMDHLNKEGGILRRLESEEHIICLRYYLSSFAYQALYCNLEWLRSINAKCRRPDLTLFIEVPVEICLEGLNESKLYIKDELTKEREKLEKIQKNYLEAIETLRAEGEEIIIIKGNRPASAIEKDIKQYVTNLMRQDA